MIFGFFSYLDLNIEQMVRTGQPVWPIERTLLATGIFDALGRSLADDGKVLETPHLNIHYQPPVKDAIWPNSSEPKGASLDPWPPADFAFIAEPGRRATTATRPSR